MAMRNDNLRIAPRRAMLCKTMPSVTCPKCGKLQSTLTAPLGRNFNSLGQPGSQMTSGNFGVSWNQLDDNWVPVCLDERCRHWFYLPIFQTADGVPNAIMHRVLQIYHLTNDSGAAQVAFEDLRNRGWKEADER